MTYKDLMENLRKELKDNHDKAKEALEDGNKEFVADKRVIDYKKELIYFDTLEEAKKAFEDAEKFHKETIWLQMYIRLNHYVEGYSLGMGEGIEIESVDTFWQIDGYLPKSSKEMEEILSLDTNMSKYIIIDYITDLVHKVKGKQVFKRKVECTIIDLFKRGVINFEQVVKAVYLNC